MGSSGSKGCVGRQLQRCQLGAAAGETRPGTEAEKRPGRQAAHAARQPAGSAQGGARGVEEAWTAAGQPGQERSGSGRGGDKGRPGRQAPPAHPASKATPMAGRAQWGRQPPILHSDPPILHSTPPVLHSRCIPRAELPKHPGRGRQGQERCKQGTQGGQAQGGVARGGRDSRGNRRARQQDGGRCDKSSRGR